MPSQKPVLKIDINIKRGEKLLFTSSVEDSNADNLVASQARTLAEHTLMRFKEKQPQKTREFDELETKRKALPSNSPDRSKLEQSEAYTEVKAFVANGIAEGDIVEVIGPSFSETYALDVELNI